MLSLLHFWLLGLLILLGGCSGSPLWESFFAPDSSLNSADNPDPITKINQPSLDNNSSIKVQLPDNFPEDIPVYPEANLVKVDNNKLVWSSKDPVNLIINYYDQELSNKQWQVEQTEDNLILATKADTMEKIKLSLTKKESGTDFTLTYNYPQAVNSNINSSATSQLPTATNNNNSGPSTSNLSSSPLPELIRLGIVEVSTEEINPYQTISRREYANWLLQANNLLFKDVNSKQIRSANPNSKPVFNDVNNSDPDFPIIQGLAEAGLIPSHLTQNSDAISFRPDASLTREDLIAWKVPLDFRQNLPNASLDTIRETWGFQDASTIKPEIWPKLYVDWQNGENSNLRRAFGYITLFQPQKPVTYEEAARVLVNFGYQGEIHSLTTENKL